MIYGVIARSHSKVKGLPRPNHVRRVLFKSTSRDECLDWLMEHAADDEFQSSQEVEIELSVVHIDGLNDFSTSRRPGNGSR